jgi:hypothetical protein
MQRFTQFGATVRVCEERVLGADAFTLSLQLNLTIILTKRAAFQTRSK